MHFSVTSTRTFIWPMWFRARRCRRLTTAIRQMLQHLCTEDALRFVQMVARSSARFVLLSTFKTDDDFVNTDIPCTSGGYRPQDLTKPPFNLPTPLAFFDEMYPVDRRIALGLWKVGTLRHRLL